jgi:hypothetical protein
MRFSGLIFALSLLAVGCGSSASTSSDGGPGLPDGSAPEASLPATDGGLGDGGGDSGPADGGATDGETGDGGDAGKPDTCPVAQGAFVADTPPGPGAYTKRDYAVLQVPSMGGPRVYASQLYQNGSFYDATLQRLTRTGPGMWQAQSIASGGLGLSVARSLAVTHGADPCVTYTYDYNGTLRLVCASLSDRVIAPKANGALAMGDFGAAKQVVYEDGSADTLFWVEVNPTAGTPEPIENAWSFAGAAMQVDAQGKPHVVYATLTPGTPNVRTVRYATRGQNGWTKETIDTDTWSGSMEEGVSVSMVLAAGEPVVAYHHRSTRSLKLARRGMNGWTPKTLAAPPMGYPNDTVGRSVALAVDCMNRLHVVFQRDFTTDPTPNLRLYEAAIVNDALVAPMMLPMTASTAFTFYGNRPFGLSFFVGPGGKQLVSAELGSIYGPAIYFAER